MELYSRGFTHLVILAIFLVLGMTGLFVYKNYFTPTPMPTPVLETVLDGVCLPNYRVENNTSELTAEQQYATECTSKRSQSDCVKVDFYNQEKSDFVKPDGLPDCHWNKAIP